MTDQEQTAEEENAPNNRLLIHITSKYKRRIFEKNYEKIKKRLEASIIPSLKRILGVEKIGIYPARVKLNLLDSWSLFMSIEGRFNPAEIYSELCSLGYPISHSGIEFKRGVWDEEEQERIKREY